MAELQQQPQQDGRPRKRSSRVDMTAMVDVAFLLLTFFILTASLSTPKALSLGVPATGGPDKPIKCGKMMTLYLQKDQVITIAGCEEDARAVNYTAKGLRQTLTEFIQAHPDAVISVKPTDKAVYGNLVDVLDEFKILGFGKHALDTYDDADKELLASKGF